MFGTGRKLQELREQSVRLEDTIDRFSREVERLGDRQDVILDKFLTMFNQALDRIMEHNLAFEANVPNPRLAVAHREISGRSTSIMEQEVESETEAPPDGWNKTPEPDMCTMTSKG